MPFVRSLFTPRRAIGAGVAAVLIGSSVTALATTATPTPAALALPSVVPGWLHSAKVMGVTPGDQTVYLLLALKGLDPAGEHAYGVAASTPGNPLYRQWLSTDEFKQRFGAVSGAASAVTAAMKTLGATDVSTDKMGLTVSARMPASLAATVFGVTFEQVQHAGQTVRVATKEPTLPTSISSYVSAVDGLTQHPVHTDNVVAGRAAVASVPQVATATNTCLSTLPTSGVPKAYNNPKKDGATTVASTYYGSALASDKPGAAVLSGDSSTTKPYITSGYTPAQIRGAYGLNNTTYTGKGVTVGVALFYDGPDVGCDLQTFSTAFGLPDPTYLDLSEENIGTSTVGGGAPLLAPADAAGEQTLDVEAIHQMAPDAAIDYSGAVAPEDETIYPAIDTLLAAGVDVVNNSYGGIGDTDDMDAAVFATAVTDPAMTLGVGIDFSSGDGADEVAAESQREVDFPSSSDAVTAVGGTGIEIGAKNDYEGEFYWGTYSAALSADGKSWGPFASQPGGAGGGGGLSTAYAEPDWQKGVVPAEETTNADTASGYNTANGSDPTYGVAGSPGRVTPDIAMIADSTTGLLVGETQQPDANDDGSVPDTTPAYSYYRIGGTSVSSPIFSGLMADVDEALGTSAGFVNPTMYPFLARHDGAFRDPQIGRSPTGSRNAGAGATTAAQIMTNPVATTADPDPTGLGLLGSAGSTYAGTGPGVVPVVSEVRPDYTDSGNDGIATTTADPTGMTAISSTPGNPVVYNLRGQSILGTLEDLPGYDDSTGLGSPCAPQFINDFLPGMPSAGSYCTTPVGATTTGVSVTNPTPISAPVTTTPKPTTPKPTTTTSCSTVRGSSIKVYGPKTAKLNKHGQAAYSFKLFVNLGKCKTPSAVGRQFFVYVDGKKTATLRTGKNGVQNYLVRLKPGKHTITAAFVGNKDLKKSASSKFSARVI